MPVFLFLLLSAWVMQDPGPDARIAESLRLRAASGEEMYFLVVMRHQADLSDLPLIKGKSAKGKAVFQRLRAAAEATQGPVAALLRSEGAPVHPYYIVNMIRSHGDIDLMRRVAAHSAVAYIAADSPVKLDDYRQEPASPLRSFDQVTWGISRIGADSVWAMGHTGQGVVIGGQDTGYEWEHPALKPSYRGWVNGMANHDYNWHDAIYEIDPANNDSLPDPKNNPCGVQSPFPCDDHNHGTHTMGTMAGIDSTLQIGIAPDARWIGCRNMERGWGRPSTYMECFEWFLAPTDLNHENPDPDMAPHVIANSWSCPPVEGCDPSNFALMQMVVDNLRAAGVVVVVSAGNAGSGCHSINTPSAIFESSFTVGASRNTDTIANFSSRGPVMVDGSGRMKPDVTAPGVGVRSSIRGGGYADFSGTSMAGPHVAGAVALILSARPELAGEVDIIENLLEETAVFLSYADTCGGVPGTERPNPAYGWGRIDVHKAVKAALDLVLQQEEWSAEPVHIYPNPFREVIHVRAALSGHTPFVLYDAKGIEVFRTILSASDGSLHMVNMPSLPDGWYAYRLGEGAEAASGWMARQ
ncbi:MAG: S8 family serine peptidase [Saprospiraceae bacterium]|nr:S8 family serine peptidase [Saprospiraceae bacterium]